MTERKRSFLDRLKRFDPKMWDTQNYSLELSLCVAYMDSSSAFCQVQINIRQSFTTKIIN